MREKILRNGVKIPTIGMGTWQITDREAMKQVIANGYELGYHLIDTAAAYSNEISIAKAIEAKGISRDQIFITDKVWNTSRGYLEAQEACKRSLKKLKTDYLDLYLIHWPASPKLHMDWNELNAETWRGMEKLYHDGLVRAIGVCNYNVRHLNELKKTADVLPFVDQIEFHPGFSRTDIVDYCNDSDIMIEASSPLGHGEILDNDTILKIAYEHNRTAAQVCLRWAVQKGIIVIPKTEKKERLSENMEIFDFELDEKETEEIDQLGYCGGLGLDPDKVTDFG